MKPHVLFFAAALACLLLASAAVHAQKTVTWKGGAPGRETEWNCPKNWSSGAVPNCFSDVIIPDVSTASNRYPIIREWGQEVNTLVMYSGASLFIQPSGSLNVINHFDRQGGQMIAGTGVLLVEDRPNVPDLPGALPAAAQAALMVDHD